MSLKKTIGKDGKEYFFENGKPVKKEYYKLHWFEGGKGRMSNEDFQQFYSALPEDIDFETARTLQNLYYQETKGEIEEQKIENITQEGFGVEDYIPHFQIQEAVSGASKFFIKTEGTPGFQRISEEDMDGILLEFGRETNEKHKKASKRDGKNHYTSIKVFETFGNQGTEIYVDLTQLEEF